jgi:hypothetical protein
MVNVEAKTMMMLENSI